MIFLFPLVLSVLAALLFLIGDASWVAKGIGASLAAGAFLLQFGAGLREHVHFTIPLMMQFAVCATWYFSMHLD